MNVEAVCEHNGQRVLINGYTGKPVTEHDCGYEECEIRTVYSRQGYRPLNFEREDWEAVSEWADMFEE